MDPHPQVVLFGDSLFQQSIDVQDGFSFQAALQSHCQRRLDVINRGLSGWNTKNAMEYIDKIFPEPTPSSPKIAYLLVLLGANDAVLPRPFTSQHVPIEEYKANLTRIVTHPHVAAHKPKILLVTPPPLDEIKATACDMANGFPSGARSATVSAAYSEKAREVARENPGVVLIDLWQGVMDKAIAMAPGDYQAGGPWLGTPENGKQGGLDTLLPDGLHMNGDAYRILFDLVAPHIGPEWASLAEDDRTGYVLPDWRVLNPLPAAQ
ncbi:GDSL-like Lipase/Acylhydrolase [Stachybotrys elegans]|uniref:GDSL-like Lipase/Acylhydrolase n=1 Tax=Stachybotrys elegans TaxID=80388 RepID=A0A8K0WXH6_9HYPO|nr:GDSL-like Lipase/Acylhydrolase [Stachybotrys elegans]